MSTDQADTATEAVHAITDEQLLRVYWCGARAGATRLLAEGGVPAAVATQVGMSSSAAMMIGIEVDPLARLEVLTHLQTHCEQTTPSAPEPEPVAAQAPSPSRRQRLAVWAWPHRRLLWALLFLVVAVSFAAPPTVRGVFNGASVLALLFAAGAFVLAVADPKRGEQR